MSFDLYFWKWRKNAACSPGQACLLLADGLTCPDLAPIALGRIRQELDRAFPGWDGDASDRWVFECDLLENGIILNTHSSTPEEVFDWFNALASREGLFCFDPQEGPISSDDKAAVKAIRHEVEEDEASDEFPDILRRAEAGDAEAQLLAGNAFAFGEGVAPDEKRAFGFYRQAAMQGLPDAMFNLASCYRRGEGVARDIECAIGWYLKAAETDKQAATFELGEIFGTGEGVAIDATKAVHWFRIAADNGHPEARLRLRKLGAK